MKVQAFLLGKNHTGVGPFFLTVSCSRHELLSCLATDTNYGHLIKVVSTWVLLSFKIFIEFAGVALVNQII